MLYSRFESSPRSHSWEGIFVHYTVSCIICEQPLENIVCQDLSLNQPSQAVACETFGHYGTTVFDPMDGSFLEFNICDPCLVAKAKNGLILIGFAEWDDAGKQTRKHPLKIWAGPRQYRYHVDVDNGAGRSVSDTGAIAASDMETGFRNRGDKNS